MGVGEVDVPDGGEEGNDGNVSVEAAEGEDEAKGTEYVLQTCHVSDVVHLKNIWHIR